MKLKINSQQNSSKYINSLLNDEKFKEEIKNISGTKLKWKHNTINPLSSKLAAVLREVCPKDLINKSKRAQINDLRMQGETLEKQELK